MPEYIVVARMALRTTHALGRSHSPREVRVPGTWHLAEILSGVPSAVKLCGDPTIETGRSSSPGALSARVGPVKPRERKP